MRRVKKNMDFKNDTFVGLKFKQLKNGVKIIKCNKVFAPSTLPSQVDTVQNGIRIHGEVISISRKAFFDNLSYGFIVIPASIKRISGGVFQNFRNFGRHLTILCEAKKTSKYNFKGCQANVIWNYKSLIQVDGFYFQIKNHQATLICCCNCCLPK